MDEITLLEPPAYTEDERQALVDFVLALRKSYVQEFLRRVELPVLAEVVGLVLGGGPHAEGGIASPIFDADDYYCFRCPL